MSRSLKAFGAALLAMPILLAQGVLPEKWGPHTRTGAGAPLTPADPALFAEYGGEAAESAAYNGPAGKFRTSAWRFKDSTGAFGWYQSIRPENAVPLSGSQGLAVVTPGAQFLADQNYVLQFEGWRPTKRELESLNSQLPNKRSGGGLPLLPGYLPEKNRVRNSERYLVGLSGLTKFLPDFPANLAGFESGGEGQAAKFRAGDGSVRDVVIFNYLTPHIARERLAEFEKQSDWAVHRSGSLVAVAPGAKGVPGIESLVNGVEYKFDFTWNQATKLPPMPDVGGMLSAIVDLTGLLLVVCVLGGTLCAVLVSYLRRRDVRLQGTNATMVTLRIDQR